MPSFRVIKTKKEILEMLKLPEKKSIDNKKVTNYVLNGREIHRDVTNYRFPNTTHNLGSIPSRYNVPPWLEPSIQYSPNSNTDVYVSPSIDV